MSDQLNIRHHGDIRRGFPPVGACVWCGSTCWTMAETPFRPDLGQVPLHLFCGVDLREAYRVYRDGGELEPYLAGRMIAMTARLGPGPARVATDATE